MQPKPTAFDGLSVVPPTNPPRVLDLAQLVFLLPGQVFKRRGDAANYEHPVSLLVPHRHVEHRWREGYRALGWRRGLPSSNGNLSGYLRALARQDHHLEPRRPGD